MKESSRITYNIPICGQNKKQENKLANLTPWIMESDPSGKKKTLFLMCNVNWKKNKLYETDLEQGLTNEK